MTAFNLQITAGSALSLKLASRVSDAEWLAGAITLVGGPMHRISLRCAVSKHHCAPKVTGNISGCMCVNKVTSDGCKAAEGGTCNAASNVKKECKKPWHQPACLL